MRVDRELIGTCRSKIELQREEVKQKLKLRGMKLDEALLLGRPRAAQPQVDATASFS
jgi:hypothetical protein